jgi:hypothetical protein
VPRVGTIIEVHQRAVLNGDATGFEYWIYATQILFAASSSRRHESDRGGRAEGTFYKSCVIWKIVSCDWTATIALVEPFPRATRGALITIVDGTALHLQDP